MGSRISSFLDNDSVFGRMMSRCAIIIGANLMFVVFSLPVITIGSGLAALFYVMLKTLHSDDSLNPFKTFWKGFVMNLKQGILCFLGFSAAAVMLVLDIRFCNSAGGVWDIFKYACYALLILLLILAVYLMPVMAAFEDTIPHLLRNAFFFAARRPWKILIAAAVAVIPVVVTVIDTHMRPLYGFLWTTCGFGLIAMMISELLIKDIEQYLPKEDTDEETLLPDKENTAGRSQREILREMKKLDQ